MTVHDLLGRLDLALLDDGWLDGRMSEISLVIYHVFLSRLPGVSRGMEKGGVARAKISTGGN